MKTRLAFSTLSIILFLFSFSISAPQTAQPTHKPIIISGQRTPELIPTFLAWRNFIYDVDLASRHSIVDMYLSQTVRLSDIEGYSSLRSSVVQLVANFGTLTKREIIRINNKRVDFRESRERGQILQPEFSENMMSTVDEDVEALIRFCDLLRDSLVALDSEVGPAIWNQLVAFCNTNVKRGMSLTSDETPEDLAVRATWQRFEPKLMTIPRKNR